MIEVDRESVESVLIVFEFNWNTGVWQTFGIHQSIVSKNIVLGHGNVGLWKPREIFGHQRSEVRIQVNVLNFVPNLIVSEIYGTWNERGMNIFLRDQIQIDELSSRRHLGSTRSVEIFGELIGVSMSNRTVRVPQPIIYHPRCWQKGIVCMQLIRWCSEVEMLEGKVRKELESTA